MGQLSSESEMRLKRANQIRHVAGLAAWTVEYMYSTECFHPSELPRFLTATTATTDVPVMTIPQACLVTPRRALPEAILVPGTS